MPPHQYRRYTSSPKEQTARLIYEPALNGYSLSFTYNESIIDFVKKAIPSHKRTYDPVSKMWYFGEEYFDIIKLLFNGHRDYKLTIITRQEVEDRVKQQQEASQHTFRPQEHSIEEELKKFALLLFNTPLDAVKNWNRDAATKAYRKAALCLHPDRNQGNGDKMAELNNTWSILKEGYYVK